MPEPRPKDLVQVLMRLMDAGENAAQELEKLHVLKEFELGVRVVYDDGNPVVDRRPATGGAQLNK